MATSPHVLVVDNSCVGRAISTRFLEHYNIRVTSVANAEQALTFLDEANDVNLMLTIYGPLGGMSGYELLCEVKESPGLNRIPVVMVFLDESPEVVRMCMYAGADGYIFQPLRLDDVPFIMSFI